MKRYQAISVIGGSSCAPFLRRLQEDAAQRIDMALRRAPLTHGAVNCGFGGASYRSKASLETTMPG
jgi:hypothetical protein